MPISLSATSAAVSFSADLASAARLMISDQLARHPMLSDKAQPKKRAWEILSGHPDVFESVPWMQGKPHLWRLTLAEMKRRGIRYPRIGASRRSAHWLSIGDMWMTLVFSGLRPEKWFTEGKAIGGYDVFMVIRGRPFLVEVQNSEITKREWKRKWYLRMEWMNERKWTDEKWAREFTSREPAMLLVTSHHMKNVLYPKGTLYAKSMDELPRILRSPIP